VNNEQLFTAIVSSPFHLMGKYRALLERRQWVYDIKEMVWSKTTQHLQPLSNVPGASVISNCEGMVVIFCKQPSVPAEQVKMNEARFYASSELKWMCHLPSFNSTNFRETCFVLPIQEKKVEDTQKNQPVNKSEKPTALGEYIVSKNL